jgi:hypothetical protein
MPAIEDHRKRHLFVACDHNREDGFSAATIGEAMGELLDPMTGEALAAIMHRTVTVYEFEPEEPPNAERFTGAYGILDRLLEDLDEDTGGDTLPNEAMKAAEKAFVETVLTNYRHWNHELCAEHEVNVRDWCKENRPAYCEVADSHLLQGAP